MPAPSTPQPATQFPEPGPEGTSLWNLQTQAPEWVPLDQVTTKLSSGAYRQYSGSDVAVTQGIGGTQSEPAPTARTVVAGGGVVQHPEASRDLAARQADFSQQYDNAGDKTLAFVDGAVSGLSGGLLKGVPSISKYGDITQEKNLEEHPGYEGLGELAALAAVLVAPESALKYTPLGLSNELFGVGSKLANTALTTKVGSAVVRGALSDAAGGAIASGALSSAHAVGQAVQGKPVSGYAIIDDVGLGALMGGGIGAVAHGLAHVGDAKSASKAMEAAAEFDKSAPAVDNALSSVAKSWWSAHNVSGARVEALNDLVDAGLLEGEVPGKTWLKARVDAKAVADDARAKLIKVAGSDDPQAIAKYLHDLTVSGSAKDMQAVAQAFDNYGTAVAHLDDVMQPTTFDTAHLHDVIGDTDASMKADEHPLQRIEQMINNGTPDTEIQEFAKQIDDNYRRVKGQGLPNDTTVDVPTNPDNHPTPDTKTSAVNNNANKVRSEPAPRPASPDTPDTLVDRVPGSGKATSTFERPTEVSTGTRPAGVIAASDEAGFQAKKILDQARIERGTGVMSPVRPTQLGKNIQTFVDQLTAATGGRLGSPEARSLATRLGLNSAKLTGPVASKLADMWSLHRMTEQLAKQVGRAGAQKLDKSLLTKALSWGAVSGAGAVGYEAAGAFGGGAARSLARHALGTALFGAGVLTATAGRLRQAAVNGMAKVLSPAVARGLQMAAITRVVSSSYAPNVPPTTDYTTKAEQLRHIATNPDSVAKHLQDSLKGVGAVDPASYTAAVNAANQRLKNLAAALPTSGSFSIAVKSKGPTAAQIAEFHQYEAITADRELVFKYLKAGLMPQGVVSAMNEQHPDFMAELRQYVLDNPDEVQSAPHNTQMALSRLLGVPLIPEASPGFVSRMQQPYIDAKQKEAQAKQQAMGAAAIKAGIPTQAQALSVPPAR